MAHLVTVGILCVTLVMFFPAASFAAAVYTLDDLYAITIERAERIKIAEEELVISEQGTEKAFSSLLPKLSAFGTVTRYDREKYSLSGIVSQPETSTFWGVRLDHSLSVGGREFTAFSISKDSFEKSKHDLYQTKETYLFQVATAYYDVLRSRKSVDIAKANIDRLTRYRDAATHRLKVGEVTKTVLLRAEAELSGALSELIRAENSLTLSKAVLARRVSITGDYELKEPSPGQLPAGSIENSSIESLKELSLKERIELRALEIEKKMAEEQIRYAQGAYWPTVSLEGVYFRREDNPQIVTIVNENIYAALKLNFPFYEGGLRKAEVREAEARQRQSVLSYLDTKQTIHIEVETAYLNLVAQQGIVRFLDDQVIFARDNYLAVSKQFEAGLADSLDVMDANTVLVTAERQLADAQYNVRVSHLVLEKATGVFLKKILNSRPEGQ